MSQVVQSEVVKEFLRDKENIFEPSKEDLIKSSLSQLQSIPEPNNSFMIRLGFGPWIAFLVLNSALVAQAMFGSDKHIVGASLLTNAFLAFIVWSEDFSNRMKIKSTLCKLKKLLETNHYETRIQYISYFSNTLKIVVEGNIDHNGLIIKESSKHFTSYLETSNKVELVKNLVKIIEKQEKMFKVKEA